MSYIDELNEQIEAKHQRKLTALLRAMVYDYSRENRLEGFDRKINSLVLHGVKFIQHKGGYRIEPLNNVDHYERIKKSITENKAYQAALIEILRELPKMENQNLITCQGECIYKDNPTYELSYWCYLSNCEYVRNKRSIRSTIKKAYLIY